MLRGARQPRRCSEIGIALLLALLAPFAAPRPATAAETSAVVSWPRYNLDYAATRFSGLSDINGSNVSRLREICRVRVDDAGSFESGLLFIDDALYLSTAHSTVALDPLDCGVKWKSIHAVEGEEPAAVNRGLAYDGGKLFRGTTDCRLVALDAKTGAVLWKTTVCKSGAEGWLAAAPVVWKGMVFIGTAGGDWGIRGRMFAFNAVSGAKLWEFHTVPDPGEPGADTWKGNSARTGGGATWTTYTLDPSSGELFIPVGNAAADFNMEARAGAARYSNLYTNSLVVLDATTGKLKWWYQVNAHDDKDLDLGAAPVLYERSGGRPSVAMGSKDGRLYVVDRTTHRLAFRTPVTTILNQDKPVTREGITVCPGILGGVEWNGPSLDALHASIVVGAVDWCAFVTQDAALTHEPGQTFFGGTFKLAADPPPTGWITSVEMNTGRVRWRFHADGPVVSGVTTTAGRLVFAGDMTGALYALDSADGTVKFKTHTGGAVAGGVITYRTQERQLIAVTSGNLSRGAWGESGLPSIVLYGVSETGAPESSGAADSRHGKSIYAEVCAACHGSAGEGLTGPPLKSIAARLSVAEIAAWIFNPVKLGSADAREPAMPRLFPSVLKRQDVLDVAAFVPELHGGT